MDTKKLFRMLVVGGAVLAANSGCGEDQDDGDAGTGDGGTADAGDGGTNVDAGNTGGPDGGSADAGGAPCFCDFQDCCEQHSSGNVLQQGFYCCWGTTC